MKQLVNRILHNFKLHQTARDFRDAADLAMERGHADFLLAQAFNEAGYHGVSHKDAKAAAAIALSVLAHSGRMTPAAIENRMREYLAQWNFGAETRRREETARHKPPPGTSLIRT